MTRTARVCCRGSIHNIYDRSSGCCMKVFMTLLGFLMATSCQQRLRAVRVVSSYQWLSVRTLPRRRKIPRIVASRLFVSSSGSDTARTDAQTIAPATISRINRNFVPFPFDYHELVDLRIDTLTNSGWGLGRVDVSDRGEPPPPAERPNRRGRQRRRKEEEETNEESNDDLDPAAGDSAPSRWVVMTPNVIPGELVRVRIFRNYKSYSEADVVEILEPNVEDRIQPICPLANECGGCQYQHMSIQSQRKWKMASVQESLRQYGIVDVTVSPTMGTDEIFGYRSKLTPHFEAPKRRSGEKNIEAVGFLRQTSRSIVDVPSCPIATAAVNEKYQRVRDELLSQPSDRVLAASVLLRQANLEDSSHLVSTNHDDYITTRVRGIDFTYQAGNFFQNNYYVVPLMVDEVLRYASLPSPSTGAPMTHFVDCYCGSGLFALSAASQFATVVGIEVNKKAVAEATANAVANHISNCRFLASSAEYIFHNIGHFPKDTTAVVLDPPRKGCSVDFLQQLYAFAPQRIVYMSCDPHTQARDAKGILDTGKYRLVHVQPFDLFPQTRHIECLAIFERTS